MRGKVMVFWPTSRTIKGIAATAGITAFHPWWTPIRSSISPMSAMTKTVDKTASSSTVLTVASASILKNVRRAMRVSTPAPKPPTIPSPPISATGGWPGLFMSFPVIPAWAKRGMRMYKSAKVLIAETSTVIQ
jgi:hypothetical protein